MKPLLFLTALACFVFGNGSSTLADEIKFDSETRKILRFAHQSAKRFEGYQAGIPTFSVIEREAQDALVHYSGAILFKSGTVKVQDLNWKEILKKEPDAKRNYRHLMQALHEIARDRGYAGAHPNGELATGKIGVIWIKKSSAFTDDIDNGRINNKTTQDEVYNMIRVYSSTRPNHAGGYPNGHRATGKIGVVWIRPEAADMIWLKH